MIDTAILFSIFSLFIGAAAISISIFINQSNKKRALELFIGLNLSFFLIQNSIILNSYSARVESPAEYIPILSKVLDTVGTSFSSFFGMFLINSILGKEISNSKKQIITAVSSFQLVAITIYYVFDIMYLEYICKISIILVIVYEILITVINYKHIGNKELKKIVNIFTMITLIFFPLFIFEAYRTYIPLLKNVIILKMLSLPTYFLVINIYSLIFVNKYFNSPAFVEDDKLTEFFINKYSVTKKEVEVIELLLAGLTYKQIAENLFIASKTVDNHIQNIYKKLEVTNKIQLFNLIHSKEK
jgi:DNA-binding CsgD family transcriptional regulator